MSKAIHVFLVDDEARFVLNMAKLLRNRGFVVSTAFDGAEAVKAVESGKGFDVVVLDVKMPGVDGIKTLKQIKARAPATEVIMLTGHATLESGVEAMRAGAFDYLMKPCDPEDLIEKIKEAREVESMKRHPILWPRQLVKEITWPSFIRLEAQDSLEMALNVFILEPGMKAREELYVLDAEDRFQGVITRRDLLNAAQKAHPNREVTWADLVKNPECLPRKPLTEVMRPNHPLAAEPETDLAEAARQMMEHKVRYMPVVEEGKVTGIVRLVDVLLHLQYLSE